MTPSSEPFFDVCMLSHGNWPDTARALESAWRLGLHVHLGLTAVGPCPFFNPLMSIHCIVWRDDFAAARNDLLDRIKSERPYLLWIDSDEEILCYPSAAPADHDALLFDVKLSGKKGLTAGRRASLHRNVPAIRWIGAIHERLALASGNPLPRVMTLHGLAVLHHGYQDDTEVLVKLSRNAAIADTAIKKGSDYPGATVSIVRKQAAHGRATAQDWITVYKSTEAFGRRHGYPPDVCWEAAAGLACCGYTKPAEHLSAQNPLILPLQLSLLVSGYAQTGEIEQARFNLLFSCLERSLWDDRFPFDTLLLSSTRQELADYIVREANGLSWRKETGRDKKRSAPVASKTVFTQCSDVVLETFEDDTLLLSPETHRVVSLNATGKIFWDALAAGVSVEDCGDMMAEASGNLLSTEALAQIEKFFHELLDSGMIREA